MEAAASVVGIVSFGLGLAKSLQAFIESVIESEETMTLIVADVNATASTLKRLQDFIDQDKAASEEEHRATVFNSTGIREIGACALQCQKIYVQIIILIERASMQASEDESENTGTQSLVAEELSKSAVRLEAFSKNVTKLGRKMRWPWLEPRIKRCQEHLGRLKISLMLSLQVFLIARSRARPSVARICGTDEENDMRDRAETLRKRMTEIRAKTGPPKQAKIQSPASDNGARDEAVSSSSTSDASTTSVNSSSSSEVQADLPASSSSSLTSNIVQKSRRSRRLRASRVLRTFRAFKAQIRNRTERKSIFKKDSTSVMFEAYLIYRVPGPFPGNSSPPPMKLPFGHRRLTREIKRTLRKFNPWDILLILSPQHRALVDRVVRHVQRAATGTTSVCLVAIDVDGHVNFEGDSDADISDLEAGDLVWTKMVLFFRHEPAHARKGTTEAGIDVIRGRSRLTATIRNIFLGSRRQSKKRLEVQERADQQRREDDRVAEERRRRDTRIAEEERMRLEIQHRIEAEIAKRDAQTRARQNEERMSQQRQMEHDRRVAEEARLKLLEMQRQKEADERRKREEREALERDIKDAIRLEIIARERQEREGQGLKDLDAASEDVEKGIGEGKLKVSEADRAKMEAKEERAAEEKTKPPVTFRDAVGRKFGFPFHLVQTWEGMEDLIKQAFVHVEVIGPQVQEGRYDLIDSEGKVILPSLWSVSIKPGETVSMRMWPENKIPPSGPQHMSPGQRPHFQMAQQRDLAAQALGAQALGAQALADRPHGAHRGGFVQDMAPPPGLPMDAFVGGHLPPPLSRMHQAPPPLAAAGGPALAGVVEGGRPKKEKPRAKKALVSFRSSKPRKKGGKDKHKDPKSKVMESRDEDAEKTDEGENVEDIDKELGLDGLEGAEQMNAKDIDELLDVWTNSARNEEQD